MLTDRLTDHTQGRHRRRGVVATLFPAAVLGAWAAGGKSAAAARLPGASDRTAAPALLAPEISVTSGAVRPGHAFLAEIKVALESDGAGAPLSVTASLGPKGAAGSLGALGTETPGALALHPFPVGAARFVTLAAVPMDEPPGEWAITAAVRNGPGLESAASATVLSVVDGGFPVQRLPVPAQVVPLLDPDIGALERLTLATVMAESAPRPLWQGRFLSPVTGGLVTAHGARRAYVDPGGGVAANGQHAGVDLAAPAGAAIVAPAAGIVAFAGTWSIRGNVVVLDHGAGVHSVYGHASSIAVAAGQAVARGQVLGRVGSTGLSTGPHLHWEVRVAGVAVEPLEWTQRPD